MKKRIIALGIFLSLIVSAVIILPQTLLKPEPIHIHAGFQVYADDKLQDLSDFKYMHEMPCSIDGKPVEGAPKDEQQERAHLHDQTGDVVHVHRQGGTWGDLFKNIKYEINDEEAVVYSNGQKIENFLDREIVPYESIVIFAGKHTDDQKYLKSAVKKDYILQVEKKSETCGS